MKELREGVEIGRRSQSAVDGTGAQRSLICLALRDESIRRT
jgi:hypothetical protein